MIELLLTLAALALPGQEATSQDDGAVRARPEILERLRSGAAPPQQEQPETGTVEGRVVIDPADVIQAEPLPGAVFHDALRCWLELEPAEVEIGEPIECTLHVVYPPGVEVRIKDEALKLDDSWVVLESARVVTGDDPPDEHTRARWVVASLEPGEREIVLTEGQYEAQGTLHGLKPAPARVRVRPALDEGEDAPRPARGFRPAPEGAEPSLRAAWIAGGALLTVLAVTGFVALRARRKRPALAAPPRPRERLARIDGAGLEDPQRVRALVFELCAILRAIQDERAGVDRRGATDEEWLAASASDAGLTPELHAELASFVAKAGSVKYGQERPTRWAAEETLNAARALGERLAQKPGERT